MPRKNIFLIGLNDFNRAKLQSIRNAESCNFVGVLDPAELLETEYFPIPDMLRRAEAQIAAFDGPIDSIAGYMDFPVSTMLPILCRRFGTRTPSLESLLKCEHKYWSRLEQQKVIKRYIPRFQAFDPFDDDALDKIPFAYPFWVKPIKSSGSRLGFRINHEDDFRHAVSVLREEIGLIQEPFDYVLEHIELPPEVAGVGGGHCLAEEIIGGRQCTLEGYVFEGEVRVYGVVDSIRYPQNNISFFRYQYPSRLPKRVQRRMIELTERVMRHIGFDNSAFNVEFFWNEQSKRLWLLEINTRISQSHCDLFEKVDGASNHEITIECALGRRPNFPHREGRFACAGKFFYRLWEDARVTRVPTAEEIAEIERRFPGTIIAPQVREGMRLSELPEQDSYSYAVAYIFMGAKNQSRLLRDYDRVVRALDFRFEP